MKKFRDQHGLFVAEGDKIAAELLSGRFGIEMICALSSWIEKNRRHIPQGISCYEVNQKTLERISTTRSPNQVLAVLKQQDLSLPGSFPAGDMVLMLDRISDPGNMGSIIRTADWFGVREIICSPGSADIYNPKVIQATMGSFLRVRCYYSELDVVIKSCEGKMTFYSTCMEGRNVFDAARKLPAAIVIGSEAHGISPAVAELVDQKLSVPAARSNDKEGAESLNAAIAAGIVMACFRNA